MKVINEQFFEATKELMQKNQIIFDDNNYALYSNAFCIINTFTNHKLTIEEIFVAYGILSDVANNERPDLAVCVKKEDRIQTLVRIMEVLPETKGKLTDDEKMAMAFCIITGECTRVFDEKSNSFSNGITLFDSFDHIKKEFEYEKSQFPSRFVLNNSKSSLSEFAFSVNNAINAVSISDAETYLSKLKYKGQQIFYSRVGSLFDDNNNIIDCYELFYFEKSFFTKTKKNICKVYINPNCLSNSKEIPKGFSL